jgi:hypothetical protein
MMGHCKNCLFLKEDKFAPHPAAGRCEAISQRYGTDTAWAELGNMFLRIYVGADFGCIHFEQRPDTDAAH